MMGEKVMNQTKKLNVPKRATVKSHIRNGMPFVALTGFWLSHFGFTPGSRVEVFGTGGHITLKLAGVASHYNVYLGKPAPQDAFVVNRPMKHIYVPQLALTDRQLTNYGFNVGDKLLISCEWGFIYLKRDKETGSLKLPQSI